MKIHTIGSIAAELFEQSQTVVVQGITSRGIFLRLESGWVVFLSREAARGPLTLNIEDEPGLLDSFSMGDELPIGPKTEIASSSAALQRPPRNDIPHLDIHQAQVWSAPPRPANFLPAAERAFAVASTIRQAQNLRLTPSLAAFQAELDNANHAPDGEAGLFFPHLVRIKDALTNRHRSTAEAFKSPLRQLDLHSFSGLLGLGRGLTPSGDDILLGLLLALNRWRQLLAPRLDVTALNRNIVPQAYQRTTTIAANLIECASRGQADERLITALDGLVTGTSDPAEAAQLLAGWGSSSGLDALCGMALVI